MKTTEASISLSAEAKVPTKAWLILAVTYFASFMAPMAQFKIPPLASWLIPYFGMDGATFGLLMSALAIIGVVLAFPAAFICRAFGLKATMLISVGCLCVGSFVGAITDNLYVLMASRMLEGVGIGLIGVAAPTCITVWFPERRRGLALGIWATWVPAGIILMFNTAPALAQAAGFRFVFFAVAALSLLAFICFAAVFTLPAGEDGDITAGGTFLDGMRYLKTKNIWLLGVLFICFCGTSLAITNSYYNTFLETVRGFSAVDSSFVTSLCTLLGIPIQVFVGWLTDRTALRNRRWLFVAMAVTMCASFFIMFDTGQAADACMWGFVILQALGGGIAMGSLRPTAPALVEGGALGAAMAMAVLQLFQNLGSAIFAPLFGFAYQQIGWFGASMAIQVPLMVVAFACAVFIVPKQRD